MPPIPPALWPPALALALAAAGAALGRSKSRQRWLPAAGAFAILAGWALLPPAAGLVRAAMRPGNGPELLLVPGLAILAAALVPAGRAARWAGWAALWVSAWWIAQSPAARPEFWRAGAATLALAWLLRRALRGEPARGLAAAAALLTGLALAGTATSWRSAAAVAAAAALGLSASAPGTAPPAALLAALVVAAALGTVRFGGPVGLAEMACLAALLAPMLVPVALQPLARRLGRRLPWLQQAAAGLLAGIAAAGLLWLLQRALLR